MIARLSALAMMLALAACAAAMPGYMPPPLTENKNKLAQPMNSGDLGPDGRYHLGESEKAMDCKRLTGSMQITLARLKDAFYRAEPSPVSTMAQSVSRPVLGGSSVGAGRQELYARERAKLDAYNDELAARGCKTLDIEAELARPAEGPKKY
jgi:hypothetical protein